MTAPQTPAPAEHPAVGAGLPAGAYDALHALADDWDIERATHEHWELHWRARGDAMREGLAAGRVRQARDCATALRNLANDLNKETACNPE